MQNERKLNEIFGYVFECTWAKKKTLWWSNDWKPGRRFRIRKDYIFSFHRVYSRTLKIYMYVLVIGRLKIDFAKKNQRGFIWKS